MNAQHVEAVVGCFIINDKHEILLVKSYKWPDKWVVCGGHIELGETIAQTAVREAKEEVGLDVKFIGVIEVAEFVFNPNFHAKKHFVGLQSECQVVGDPTPKIDNDEIQEARWFPLAQAAELSNIIPITKSTIHKLLSDQSTS